MRKILKSLPRTWKAKVTAIQEAKDLNTLPLEKLIGFLMIHELAMSRHNEEDNKKKKIIALKSMVDEEEDDLSINEKNDEDMDLVIRTFKKLMGRRR